MSTLRQRLKDARSTPESVELAAIRPDDNVAASTTPSDWGEQFLSIYFDREHRRQKDVPLIFTKVAHEWSRAQQGRSASDHHPHIVSKIANKWSPPLERLKDSPGRQILPGDIRTRREPDIYTYKHIGRAKPDFTSMLKEVADYDNASDAANGWIRASKSIHKNTIPIRFPDHFRHTSFVSPCVKFIQWNIERGYRLELIAEELKAELDSTPIMSIEDQLRKFGRVHPKIVTGVVICLQEIDVGCSRSEWIDTGIFLSKYLNLHYAYANEFQEIYAPNRPEEVQGGGCHGNGILTSFEFRPGSLSMLEHMHNERIYDWNDPEKSWSIKEPRIGERFTLVSDILIPTISEEWSNLLVGEFDVHSETIQTTQKVVLTQVSTYTSTSKKSSTPPFTLLPLRVYCTHLEVFCGILGRLLCISEIFEDSRNHYGKSISEPFSNPYSRSDSLIRETNCDIAPSSHHHLIMGDLNTIAHSIARLSSKYCTDALRFGTLGFTEAEWFTQNVLLVPDVYTDGKYTPKANPNLLVHSAFLKDSVKSLRNPGFFDPFDMYEDVTLINYKKIFQGKLDWILLRNMEPSAWATCAHSRGSAKCKCGSIFPEQPLRMGNRSYSASDHKSMICTVTLSKPSGYVTTNLGNSTPQYPTNLTLNRFMSVRSPFVRWMTILRPTFLSLAVLWVLYIHFIKLMVTLLGK